MASLSKNVQLYLTRMSEDWRDHQRVLPWGDSPPTATAIAAAIHVDPSTVARWQKAVCPIPVEAAYKLAPLYGTQYLSYLSLKNNLEVVPLHHRFHPRKEPHMNAYANLQDLHVKILPVLAKVDRGETLSLEERSLVAFWHAESIRRIHDIAADILEGDEK